jgi:hypothetical protein
MYSKHTTLLCMCKSVPLHTHTNVTYLARSSSTALFTDAMDVQQQFALQNHSFKSSSCKSQTCNLVFNYPFSLLQTFCYAISFGLRLHMYREALVYDGILIVAWLHLSLCFNTLLELLSQVICIRLCVKCELIRISCVHVPSRRVAMPSARALPPPSKLQH